MNEKEQIQRTIVNGIRLVFNHCGIRLGRVCAYASYITKDLIKGK